jgi:hypothetical protein
MLRKKSKGDRPVDGDEQAAVEDALDDAAEADTEVMSEAEAVAEAEGYDRSTGPYDITEAEDGGSDDDERLDLGALQLPLLEGMEVRVDIDPETSQPATVTVIRGEGAVQLRVFAAPKSGGGWDEARAAIRRSINDDGGTVDEVEGAMGVELHTTAYVQDEDGKPVPQRMRFVGVDGPRWMLQGVLLGAGTVPEAAAALEEVYRGIVVVRGEAALPPGTPLQLTLPEQVPGDYEEIDDDEGDH